MLAVERRTGRRVAVKACSKRALARRPARIPRTSEVEALQRVWLGLPACSQIVELYATYEDSNYLYLVLELATGGDLFQHLATQELFSEQDAAEIGMLEHNSSWHHGGGAGRGLLKAVAHCHARGVVHRDLGPLELPAGQQKPENILLATKDGLHIKVVDFGSAAIVDDDAKLTDFMGTAFYSAPEVWTHSYSKEVDLWSVGAVIYVLVTGLPPVLNSRNVQANQTWLNLQAGKVVALPCSSSSELTDLLVKLLEPDPQLRLEAADALEHPWVSGAVPLSTRNLEGSIRNMRLFALANKFQQAAVVLLSATVQAKVLDQLAAEIQAHKSDAGEIQITLPELERVLLDLGLRMQQKQLLGLWSAMLGGQLTTTAETVFGKQLFLDLLECRRLALRHLNRPGKLDGLQRSAAWAGITTWLSPSPPGQQSSKHAMRKGPAEGAVPRTQSVPVSLNELARSLGASLQSEQQTQKRGKVVPPSALPSFSPTSHLRAAAKVFRFSASSSVHGETLYKSLMATSGAF
eukprot:SM000024S07874  [mRNA]  locus=s24:1009868:1012641:- [translate_table: standard]